jgi:alpha-mannosidase
LWCSTNQTDPNSETDPTGEDNSEIEETDPYLSDLYSDDEDSANQPVGDHGSPHAPKPYDGSPFRLSQLGHRQSANVTNTADDSSPDANSLWRDAVLLIPTVSIWSLHEGFAASAAASSAAMVSGHADRDEITQRLTAILGLRTDNAIEEWASEFYALGYAWLQVQLLTRKIRYSSNLNAERFESALIKSALAVVADEYETAEVELTTCYDSLMEEKNNYYPVKPDLIDLVLTSPKTLGRSFETEVESSHPSNFYMTGNTIETLAQRNTETTELLRKRFADHSASLVGGNQFELPAPLMSKDSAVNQILQNSRTARQTFETEPKVFLRRRAGLTSGLPLLLEQLDFVGAVHVSFDRGRVPAGSSGTIAWSGPGDSSIMAKTEAPLDASDAATFLDFSVQFGRQLDSAHSATMILVHWPGKTQSTFHDLVRISSRSPVLGTFQTFEDHFDEIYDPGYGDTFLPDEYRAGYLAEACKSNSLAPISSIVSYWKNTWKLKSLAHLNTWIAVANKLNPTERSATHQCASIAYRIRSAQHWVEQQTESWQPSANELDTEISEIEDTVLQQLRRVCGAESDSFTIPVIFNPLGFRRRLALTTTVDSAANNTTFSNSQKPYQLSVADTAKPVRHWIVDVDSFGATRLQKHANATSSDGKREPDVLVGEKLQNEFFVATIDAKSGGLRSIQFHDKRGNRGGQRLVHHDRTRPNASSQMVCRSMKQTAISKIGGQIETAGVILVAGEEVAEFRQTFRLLRGQRYLEVEIELTPKITTPSSTETWFASQLAWQDESCSLHAACQLAKYQAVNPQIQSPNFVEITMTDYSLTLLAGGLPTKTFGRTVVLRDANWIRC